MKYKNKNLDLKKLISVDITIKRIERKKRKTIGLHIDNNGELIIKIPYGTDFQFVLNVIKRHKIWIEKTKNKIIQKNSFIKRRKFVNGEKFLILGKKYTLNILNINELVSNEIFNVKFFDSKNFNKNTKLNKIGQLSIFNNFSNLFEIISDIKLKEKYNFLKLEDKKTLIKKGNIKNELTTLTTIKIKNNKIRYILYDDFKHLILAIKGRVYEFIIKDFYLYFIDYNFLNLKGIDELKEIFTIFYRIIAEKVFRNRIDYYSKMYGIKYNRIRISNAKRKWGSCSYKNNINIVWRLVMAPIKVVDYVIVHELVHINHKHHKRSFWKCIEKIIPDYKKMMKYLKDKGDYLDLSIEHTNIE